MLSLISGYSLAVFEKTVGKIILNLRKQRKLSQEDLADLIDSHQVYISEIERGMKLPSLRTLYNLAHAFGMTLTDLVAIIDRDLSDMAD